MYCPSVAFFEIIYSTYNRCFLLKSSYLFANLRVNISGIAPNKAISNNPKEYVHNIIKEDTN